MKVSKIQIPRAVKNIVATVPLLLASQTVMPNTLNLQEDIFVKSQEIDKKYKNELSPEVKIDGQVVYPALVVDISDGLLYHYDYDGYLIDEYPVRMIKNKIKPGVNLVEVTEHKYDKENTSPKIVLTRVDQSNGRVLKSPQQVIVGSKGESKDEASGIHTNVIMVDNKVAQKITEFLTEEQFVLIRK